MIWSILVTIVITTFVVLISLLIGYGLGVRNRPE